MKTLFKKVTSALLVLSIMFTSTISSFAQTASDNIVRKNIVYEKGSIEELLESSNSNSVASRQTTDRSKKLVYTYDENGMKYKVYGEANNDLTYANSQIYNIKAGKETLVRTETVVVKNNVVTTTINENGKTTVDKLDLNEDKIEESSNRLIQLNGTWSGYPVSNTFVEWATFKRTKAITGTTSTSVTAVINAIVKFSNIDKRAKIAVTAISVIVNYIVQINAKKTYYNEVVSFRWTEIPNVAVQQKAVERTERTFYTDSNRATAVQIVTTTSYAQDYKN
ncbi:hypothetical protein [Lacrimispora sp.]|uniref:hypothetical protein n=1 Tax=Lacrimispora sp. TaxID=2719234 RepID=UPI0028B1B0A3|nr:hypothetical protein [Lacrimispora sp.]